MAGRDEKKCLDASKALEAAIKKMAKNDRETIEKLSDEKQVLETEKQVLETEKQVLETEKQVLETDKQDLLRDYHDLRQDYKKVKSKLEFLQEVLGDVANASNDDSSLGCSSSSSLGQGGSSGRVRRSRSAGC